MIIASPVSGTISLNGEFSPCCNAHPADPTNAMDTIVKLTETPCGACRDGGPRNGHKIQTLFIHRHNAPTMSTCMGSLTVALTRRKSSREARDLPPSMLTVTSPLLVPP